MKLNLILLIDRIHRALYRLLLGRERFCTECEGPYTGWLRQYGGHWDSCPNREN